MLTKKICMLGAYAVGKTSMVRRFVSSIYEDKYHTTIGVKIDKKVVNVDGRDVTLMIWDMAGKDEFEDVPMKWLNSAGGYLLVVDGTRRGTLDIAMALRQRVEAEHGPLPFALALNKADLTDKWDVGEAAVTDLTARGVPAFKASARTGEGIEEAFATLARRVAAKATG